MFSRIAVVFFISLFLGACSGVPLSVAWEAWRTDFDDIRSMPGSDWRMLIESENGIFPKSLAGGLSLSVAQNEKIVLNSDIPFEFIENGENGLLFQAQNPDQIDAFFAKIDGLKNVGFSLGVLLHLCDKDEQDLDLDNRFSVYMTLPRSGRFLKVFETKNLQKRLKKEGVEIDDIQKSILETEEKKFCPTTAL